jgi:hypothetical protein
MTMHTDDDALAAYPQWPDKGEPLGGTRLTLLAQRTEVETGELVRVFHIVEESAAGRTLFDAGPKPITDEFVDGARVSAWSASGGDYPWLPADYDGEMRESPGIDARFMVTEYRFAEPGEHRIEWCPGHYRSNLLVLRVKATG